MPDGRCMVPPPGWWCPRQPGHDGPCAAQPEDEGALARALLGLGGVTREQATEKAAIIVDLLAYWNESATNLGNSVDR
jgi:hypothetical protein